MKNIDPTLMTLLIVAISSRSLHFLAGLPLLINCHFLEGFIVSASNLIQSFAKMSDPAANTAATGEQLNLKVKSQDGEEVFFKIKSSTQLKKLMDAYCQRQNLSPGNVRFLFDGERLHEGQTPKDLNMENGDEIDVVIEQVGGSETGPKNTSE